MPLQVYRLRRILAATAVVLTLVVAGMYFYARSRTVDVRKKITSKLPFEIKQTTNGFQYSNSDGKRTLFTVQAKDVKEFKLNGDADLHNVKITLYGRDSSRFDQIYGDDFSYNQKTGDVTARGEVQIDLVANPTGLASPDQSAPQQLKNPIHMKTRDLVFNKDTGNAATDARVDFVTPQATGWAVGVKYAGKSNVLTLSSQIHVVLNGPNAAVVEAEHGVITNDPHEIVLDHARLNRGSGTMQSNNAVFFLGPDNQVQRVLATGDVTTQVRVVKKESSASAQENTAAENAGVQPQSEIHGRSDQAEFLLTGNQSLLRTVTLTGNVHFEQIGAQPMQGDAGRAIVDFAGRNEVQKIHAVDGARLTQKAANTPESAKKGQGNGPQDYELTAPVIDFTLAQGRVLQRAVTSGAAQITITQPSESAPNSNQASVQKTVVTAGKFNAEFAELNGRNTITTMHGAPNARIVNSTPGEPDRVSTSDFVDAKFLPQGGIESVTQTGNVIYNDGQPPEKLMQAWANTARYTPADQILLLTGSPRVSNGGTATTANSVRINRATNEAIAEGDVKTSYSDVKEQPNGALLSSSSPIHVTSRTMTVHNDSGIALYQGNARLWQDANVIEAPSIQFDRDKRFVTAQGTAARPVQTILVQKEKDASSAGSTNSSKKTSASAQSGADAGLGNSSPIAITALKLTYADAERKAHYEGGVVAKGVDFSASAKTADAYLVARSQTATGQSTAGPSQLDHMVAIDNVVVRQPNRHADGQKLVYTASDDKFVLTGGPPSIFDAEQGKITGVSLTFFRRDDRVLVEGEASAPLATTTRVAH
jgi:lipopolysaccharide export system protein LptA